MNSITRRSVVGGGLSMAALGAAGLPRLAFAATENESIVAAAKGLGGGNLKGMIWSNYYVAMTPSMERFKQATGIGVGSIQDISIFVIPQRAMAEALSRSPEFDFFHVDSNMIPSLASAGLLEPLDDYMQKASFGIDAVGTYGNFMRYKGKTYGVPTDGNVHVQFTRKDLMENPEERKRFEDKHGRKPDYPVTWEDDQQLMEFFHRPDQDLYGSANLRNRANGVTWWYMYFYSAGGFPFDDDMNPTLDTPAGRYGVETYLNVKKVSHPEAPGWGTPQMIPRITGGKAFSCQYWDGIIALIESPTAKTKTRGMWRYGLVPGSKFSGKLIHRCFSAPVMGMVVNRHSPRKKQAVAWAMYMSTYKNSAEVVGHPKFTFHDPWHPKHMTDPQVTKVYTPEGIKSVRDNLLVTAPPPYVTGYQEFKEVVDRNLSEAYAGRKKGAKKVMGDIQSEWAKVIRKVGKRKLKREIPYYKAMMPKVNAPS